jgi:23S rRNA (guanosine2251-2'-O)-methyltransferase
MSYSSDRNKNDKPKRGHKYRGDKPRGEKKSWDKPWQDKKRDGDRPSWKDKKRNGDKPAWKDKKRDGDKDRKFGDKKFRDRDRDFKDKRSDRPDFRDKKNFKKDFRKDFKKDFKKDRSDSEQKREPREPRPNVYGFHAVREAWLNPARKIKTLYLTESAEAEFAPVLKQAYESGIERPSAVTIDKQKLDFMLPRNTVHQGIGIIAEDLDEVSIQDFIIKSKSQDKTVLLMLDQVTDPHNVGAILRSACAFGADGVIMQRKNSPLLEGALAKTASGAVEHIKVAYETNLSRSIEELKEEGFFVFGLDERGERGVGDILRNNDDKNHKLVLVLGAEGPGMRRLVKEHCDELVKLPTSGALSSLNVSNAAAVALYALLK